MRNQSSRLFLIALVLLGFFSGQAYTQENVRMSELAKDLGLNVSYNPFLDQIMLSSQTRILLMATNSQLGLLNGTIPVLVPGLSKDRNGILVGSLETRAFLQNLFVPPAEYQGRRISAIFLDPGHGGRDPGAIGRHQVDGKSEVLQEKDVVLEVTLQVAELLGQNFPGVRIVLSRDSDVYLTLEERTNLANGIDLQENENILYLSIHANAAINRRARGFEVWYLPPDYRRQLIAPGDLEVLSDSVIPILNTILEEEITVESILLSQAISESLDIEVGDLSPNRGLFEEEWYVVRNARMPSVLVELGFLTNADEFGLLQDPEYLKKLSRGIYTGVARFMNNFESVR